MDNLEVLKWIASQGPAAVIAALVFYFYRRDVKHYTELWKGQSEALMEVVKDNSTNTATNTEVLRALHRRLDNFRER